MHSLLSAKHRQLPVSPAPRTVQLYGELLGILALSSASVTETSQMHNPRLAGEGQVSL